MGPFWDTQPISHSNSSLITTFFVVLDITIPSLIFFLRKKPFHLFFLAWVGFTLHFHLQEYELGHGIEMHTCSIQRGLAISRYYGLVDSTWFFLTLLCSHS